jgi:hypothetical protein
MELSWITKTKVSLVMGLGGLVIGAWLWPLAAPNNPMDIVRLANLDIKAWATLAPVALLLGFIGYFLAWPYGREIGVLAVPAGLAVWGFRSGSIGTLMQASVAAQRHEVFASLRWGPFYWLALVAIGWIGTLLAHRVRACPPIKHIETHPRRPSSLAMNMALALPISIVVSQIILVAFAQDNPTTNSTLVCQTQVCQPASGQIAFALLFAFGGAAFVAKNFLHVGFLVPAVSSAALFFLGTFFYTTPSIMSRIAQNHPAVCLPNAIVSILPIQVAAFGTIGAVTGYWLAIRYRHWRTHEC